MELTFPHDSLALRALKVDGVILWVEQSYRDSTVTYRQKIRGGS